MHSAGQAPDEASGRTTEAASIKLERPRGAIIAMVVWVLLQIPRLIAVPLVGDVLDGRESVAWLYPAILDIVVAVAAPFVAYALWRTRGLTVWVMAIVFFVVSIVDHGDAVTAAANAPAPAIFGGPDSGFPPALFPTTQAVIDVMMLIVLTSRRVRTYYVERLNTPGAETRSG